MKLLNLNFCSGLLKSSLEGFGLCLGNFLLYGGRSSVNEILRFLQTKTEFVLDDLDHIEFTLTGVGKDNVKLGLLSLSGGAGTGVPGYHDSRGGGLDTILFLKNLSKFLNVFHRKANELFCEGFYICHNCFIF